MYTTFDYINYLDVVPKLYHFYLFINFYFYFYNSKIKVKLN